MFAILRGVRPWYLLLGIFCTDQVLAQVYGADLMASQWQAASDPFVCRLTHKIPGFGSAVLEHKSKSAEQFYFEGQEQVDFAQGEVQIETLPPVWRSDLMPVNLGSATAVTGKHPVQLEAAQLAPMVAQLLAGVNILCSQQSSAAGGLRLLLNAKNFAAGYKAYQQCSADLIPYGFADVERIRINYDEKPEGLTPSQKAALAKVARYVKADAKVVGVLIDGHSDSAGTAEANETLSKQLAEWAAAYLAEQGVSLDKITSRWHGDKFPLANNKTAAGRAQNRRVTVRLENEASHRAAEKMEQEQRAADASKKSATSGANSKNPSAAAETSSPNTPGSDSSRAPSGAAPASLSAGSKALSGSALSGSLASHSVASSTIRDSAVTSSAATSRATKAGKMTPEDISRMVEGYNLDDSH